MHETSEISLETEQRQEWKKMGLVIIRILLFVKMNSRQRSCASEEKTEVEGDIAGCL